MESKFYATKEVKGRERETEEKTRNKRGNESSQV